MNSVYYIFVDFANDELLDAIKFLQLSCFFLCRIAFKGRTHYTTIFRDYIIIIQ